MSRTQLIAALGVSSALTVCGAASAAGFALGDPVSVAVRTDDLNLHTQAGAERMALRIRNAAAAACGGDAYPLAIRISDGFIRCREAAVDRALQGLDAPMVADALGHPSQRLSRRD